MPDGPHDACARLSPEAPDEAERRALTAAVAESLADPRPEIPYEEVRAEMLRDADELQRRQSLLSTPKPVLD
jgi:hypothetical protein